MYQELLRLPGARSSVVGGLLGRLPNGMRALGCLLMVSATTGSYAQAGLVAAAMTVSQAVAGPVLGRAADRHGQRRILLLALAVHSAALSSLMLLAVTRQPLWTLVATGVASGLSVLSLGSLVRARWSVLVGSTPRLPAAYALESILDELVYLIGPVLATTLAVSVFPAAGLLGSLILLTAGTLILAATSPAAPPRAAGAVRRGAGVLRTAGIPLLLGVFALMGCFFGAVDVAILAFTEERGAAAMAGLLLGLLALGSLLAGLAWGAVRSWRMGMPARLLGCTVALALAALPLLWVGTIPVMALCMLLSGIAVAPAMITGALLMEKVLPRGSLTEGFAWLSSAVAVGMASGAAGGGQLIDRTDSRAALVYAVAAAFVALLLTLAARPRLSSPAGRPPPGDTADRAGRGDSPLIPRGVSGPA
jgi:MFS family permease